VLIAPAHVTFIVNYNKDKLENPEIIEKYGVYYEEYHNGSRFAPYFTAISRIRRLLMILVLMVFRDLPAFAANSLLFLTFGSLAILIHLKPYKDSFSNKFEIFNEFTIFIDAHLKTILMQETNIG
jgi:hypothetical protein